MALNFMAADRVGGIGGYIGGISTLLGMANGGILGGNCEGDHVVNRYEAGHVSQDFRGGTEPHAHAPPERDPAD